MNPPKSPYFQGADTLMQPGHKLSALFDVKKPKKAV